MSESKTRKKNLVEKLLPYTSFILFVSTMSLIYFSTTFNADNFMEEVWFRSLKINGFSSWDKLRFAYAPAIFPDLFFYSIGSFIFEYYSDKFIFVTFCQALLIIFSLFYLLNVLNAKNQIIKIIIVFLMSLFALITANSTLGLYYNFTDDNIGSVFFTILSLSWVLKYLKTSKSQYCVYFFILSVLAVAVMPLYVVTFNATLFTVLTSLIFVHFLYAKVDKKYIKLYFLNFASVFFGMRIVEPVLFPNGVSSDRVVFSYRVFFNKLKEFSVRAC